ncbi:hypothetical protein HDU98_012248 [Podochytrium sp. JEL0797]|nr:hypothetical protein HDU98_012248 [Podochytrium sp. JEL0797]
MDSKDPSLMELCSPEAASEPPSDATEKLQNSDDIVKVSLLGKAGFTSLVNRKIDGHDIVRMTRAMKGPPRDEFIGYLEILAANGQVMCNCAKRAEIETNSDGFKTMQIRISQQTAQTLCISITLHYNSSNNKYSKRIQVIKAIPNPSAVVTKTGLYVTITDSSPRDTATIPEKPKRAYKPRGKLLQSNLSSTKQTAAPKPTVPTPASATAPLPELGLPSNSMQCDIDPLNYIQSFESRMFELGMTTFDELFNFDANTHATSQADAILDLLSLEQFFDNNGDAVSTQPSLMPPQSRDLIEVIGQPVAGGFMGSLDDMLAEATSPAFLESPFSETMFFQPESQQQPFNSTPFLAPVSESSFSRQNSFPFCDIFGSESMLTASSSATDLFSGDSLLDNMMTNCDLESLDGSIASLRTVDSNLSTTDYYQHQYHQQQLFNSQQSLISAWLPNLPDKTFPELGLSSSLSSISSLATSCSTLSNASASVAPHTASSKSASRKRQHPTTQIPLPPTTPTHTFGTKPTDKRSTPSTPSTRRNPTTTAKFNAPKHLHPTPSTTARSTTIATTLQRTRPLMTTTSTATRRPSAVACKTAFGSSVYSTSSRVSNTRPASALTGARVSGGAGTGSNRRGGARTPSGLVAVTVVRSCNTTAPTSHDVMRNVRAKTPVVVAVPPSSVPPLVAAPPTRIPTPVSCLSTMLQNQMHPTSALLVQEDGDAMMVDEEVVMEGTVPDPVVCVEHTTGGIPAATAGKDLTPDAMHLFDSLFDFSMDESEGVVAAAEGGAIVEMDPNAFNDLFQSNDWLF